MQSLLISSQAKDNTELSLVRSRFHDNLPIASRKAWWVAGMDFRLRAIPEGGGGGSPIPILMRQRLLGRLGRWSGKLCGRKLFSISNLQSNMSYSRIKEKKNPPSWSIIQRYARYWQWSWRKPQSWIKGPRGQGEVKK